jgi:hypothetical protein
MVRKRYRVVIDIDVDIEAITAERVARDQRRRAEARARLNMPPFPDYERTPGEAEIRAQNDLLDALLEDEDRLDLILLQHLIAELNDCPLEEFEDFEFRDEDVLADLFPTLPPGSRALLEEAHARDALLEEMEEFNESFSERVRNVWLMHRASDTTPDAEATLLKRFRRPEHRRWLSDNGGFLH